MPCGRIERGCGDLQRHRSDHKGKQRVRGAADLRVREPGRPEDAVDAIEEREHVRPPASVGVQGGHHGRVREQRAPERDGEATDRLAPAAVDLGQLDLRDHRVDDRGEDRLLAREVGVCRHRRRSEVEREPPHGERTQSLSVDERERCGGDPFRRERGGWRTPYCTLYGRWRAGSVRPATSGRSNALILVPTATEAELLGNGLPGRVCICGFGLAAAGAGAAHAIATHRAEAEGGVILAGAAGTYDPERLPIGAALDARAVRVDGIGAGGAGPAALGFADTDVIGLAGGDGGELLSVAEAAATPSQAAGRARRHPTAVGEEMEGFAVAVAARLFGVPLRVVRGASNLAGDRDHSSWRMADALGAVRAVIVEAA